MDYSPPLAAFTAGWEGCRLTPYQDGAGRFTVGFGHLLQPDDPHIAITQDEAEALFVTDLSYTADRVNLLIPEPLTQPQFDALVDFAFNLGCGALAGSTLRKRILSGYLDEVPDQLLRWNKRYDPASNDYVIDPGLAKRRAAERSMWLYSDYSRRP